MTRHPAIATHLVGCGAVSQLFYAPVLTRLESAGRIRLASLVDPATAGRAVLGSSFPGAVHCDQIGEAAIGAGDLVVIASPPKFHAEQSLHALGRDAFVLCEKPMAGTADEARRVVEASRASGGRLAVGHFRRFFPACQSIKALMEALPLGELQSFSIFEGGPFHWPAASQSFFRRSETPGGVLLDIGVHVLDLVRWWMGEPVEMTYSDDSMGGLEANALIELTMANGSAGTIRLSRESQTANRYKFDFERGEVEWKVGIAEQLRIRLDGMLHTLDGTLMDRSDTIARTSTSSFQAQFEDVLDAIQDDRPFRVPAEEGLSVMGLIDRCYATRTFLTPPWMESEELAAAERLHGEVRCA